jgi:replicative DNA helicase|tara:strand:+ start:2374 stop:3726 length:1353 start_codon:yes stop_codon:yes gene_type:complete
METNVGFSKYGKQFQESLAQMIMEDRPFADQIEEVLDTSFFELKYLRVFVTKLFNYRKKYNVHPTNKILAAVLRTELESHNNALQKQVRDYFARICISSVQDEKYIRETSLDFCKKQKLKEALMTSVDLIQNSSYDEVRRVIDNALNLGTDNNFGHEFLKDFELRYEVKARSPVTTGWPKVDSLMKNGLGSGELGVVIAPTGAGKSMALVHLGAHAIKAGKNVIHYTLELSEAVTGQRYDSCLSSVPLSTLFARKEEVLESISDLEGSLIIKEYPTKTASCNTLKSHIEKLKKRDQKIDMIIVDYADLLRSTTNFREKRDELGSIYEDLRAIAQENKCPLWTASQTNRTGLNAEVVTMESISEAFNKCFVADFICSISRTIKDKNANTARLFIAKNRIGPDGLVFPMFIDTSTVQLKVLAEAQAPTFESATPEDLAASLREKYKKHRQNK